MKLKASVSYEKCSFFSTIPLTCPLCGIDVPPGQPHECSKAETGKPEGERVRDLKRRASAPGSSELAKKFLKAARGKGTK